MNLKRPAAGPENIGRARRVGLVDVGSFHGREGPQESREACLGLRRQAGQFVLSFLAECAKDPPVATVWVGSVIAVRTVASGVSFSPSDTSARGASCGSATACQRLGMAGYFTARTAPECDRSPGNEPFQSRSENPWRSAPTSSVSEGFERFLSDSCFGHSPNGSEPVDE